MLNFAPATPERAEHVAQRARAADVAEVRATDGKTVGQAINAALAQSERVSCMMINDEPVAIFGVRRISMVPSIGVPWLLGTDAITENPIEFARASKKYLPEVQRGYESLRNFVDSRHKESVRWLQWLGFTIHEPIPYGVEHRYFHPFSMRCS